MLNFFKKKNSDFVIPFTGKLINIGDVPDKVFSEKSLGDGFAIEITEGKVVSPVDGIVQSVFPTGHAYGIVSNKGHEILLHIGLDTVELNGNGFEVLVQQGQKVEKGDVLCNVNIDLIKSNGKALISPIVFSGGNNFTINKPYGEVVTANEENIFTVI